MDAQEDIEGRLRRFVMLVEILELRRNAETAREIATALMDILIAILDIWGTAASQLQGTSS